MSVSRVHVFISGRVQGVCFRQHTRQQACLLGLTGWVRNLADGRVEAVFEGDSAAVEKMAAWCRRGPAYAEVRNVEQHEEPASGVFDDFSITF